MDLRAVYNQGIDNQRNELYRGYAWIKILGAMYLEGEYLYADVISIKHDDTCVSYTTKTRASLCKLSPEEIKQFKAQYGKQRIAPQSGCLGLLSDGQLTVDNVFQKGGIIFGQTGEVILNAIKAITAGGAKELTLLGKACLSLNTQGNSFIMLQKAVPQSETALVNTDGGFKSRKEFIDNQEHPVHFQLHMLLKNYVLSDQRVAIPFSCHPKFTPLPDVPLGLQMELYGKVLWYSFSLTQKGKTVKGRAKEIIAFTYDKETWLNLRNQRHNRLAGDAIYVGKDSGYASKYKFSERVSRSQEVLQRHKGSIYVIEEGAPAYTYIPTRSPYRAYFSPISLTILMYPDVVLYSGAIQRGATYKEFLQAARKIKSVELVEYFKSVQLNKGE